MTFATLMDSNTALSTEQHVYTRQFFRPFDLPVTNSQQQFPVDPRAPSTIPSHVHHFQQNVHLMMRTAWNHGQGVSMPAASGFWEMNHYESRQVADTAVYPSFPPPLDEQYLYTETQEPQLASQPNTWTPEPDVPTVFPEMDGKTGVSSSTIEDEPELAALVELRECAKKFRFRRMRLGLNQGDVGAALGKLYGNEFSQTTVSRFEGLNLSYKNMLKLKPLLLNWLVAEEDSRRQAGDDVPFESSAVSLPSDPRPTTLKTVLGVKRRKRTCFENNVRIKLEEVYRRNPKPSCEQTNELATSLQIDREVVRVWFCNRRQKDKRNRAGKSDVPLPFGYFQSTRPTGDF